MKERKKGRVPSLAGLSPKGTLMNAEKSLFKFLLFADACALIISMVAGPLNHTAIAIGAAGSAILISLCLIGYGLYVWPKRR
ncbi:hypothetical protein D1841_00850 [Neglecta sp. X4]|uniref:hypothetical protein n=2 Tax=Eubacteriales TaxID=186802 RepID=UPI00137A2F01|nr:MULTISPECIES: hypothetical protein [unclassified Neglectibacter]NBI16212.1 hypothetical protein [Neglectibacter sp. 59]NBJ71909.1 hypothetical protein [Neglectibacter sp. X4]NCE79686.1 hypothetical protein [Neglectibacter sp. X58]